MQAEMTGQPVPSSRNTPVRPSLVILFFLALIALGIYGYNAGWFNKNSASKASELLAAASTSIGQFFSKVGNSSSMYPPRAVQTTSHPDAVAESASPPAALPMPAREPLGENDIAPPAAWTPGVEDHLDMARSAFAAGDINAAVDAYRALLASNPDNIAALGELGNVFHAVRMMPAAAQAYFEAASKAIDQNQFEVAENLLPAIAEGNPMLASQLNDKLYAAAAHNNTAQSWQPAPGMYPPYQQPMPPFMQPGDRY
jgi:tetratricopeptide (TPR) repeat protein